MRTMTCRCGATVYFDDLTCVRCERRLGFDPAALDMKAEAEPGAGLPFCANRDSESRCNWLIDPAENEHNCVSCRMSRVIPDLSKAKNRKWWRRLEAAKRRLIVDLRRLDLPVDPARLGFVFKEDRRTNEAVSEAHVSTGHASGVITINAAEADAVFREQMRQSMDEPYRTLLGHYRHESGHYYFNIVIDEHNVDAARQLFGDERENYDAALNRHYEQGPPADWTERFITAYATSHPSEDWAECWAHYLHIRAALRAAEATGLDTGNATENWRFNFVDLVLSLNEIARSLGFSDVYPFVITQEIGLKIDFVHQAIADYRLKVKN